MFWSKNARKTLLLDGAEIALPVELDINASVFIPCLKFDKAFAAVNRVYRKYRYKLIWADAVEQDVLGIRVWRVS